MVGALIMVAVTSGYGNLPEGSTASQLKHRGTPVLQVRLKRIAKDLDLYRSIPLNTVYDFYVVKGVTYEQICDDIFHKETGKGSWNEKEGVRYAAEANYRYTWDGEYDYRQGKVCWKNIKVDIDNTLVFPMWDMPANPSQKAVEKWRSFVTPLKEHEFGHIVIYNAMGEKFRHTMASLEGKNSRDLREKTVKAFERFLREVDKVSADYDYETLHGRTQGAVL